MKRILLTKKGSDADSFEFGNQLPEFIVMFTLIIVLITLLITALSFMKSHQVVVPEETYYYTYITRFIYSPNCFLYKDLESGYSSGLVIDYDKFNNDQFHDCFVTDIKSTFGFRLRLVSDKVDEKIIQTENYVDKPQTTVEFPVILHSSDNIFPATIVADIIKY